MVLDVKVKRLHCGHIWPQDIVPEVSNLFRCINVNLSCAFMFCFTEEPPPPTSFKHTMPVQFSFNCAGMDFNT